VIRCDVVQCDDMRSVCVVTMTANDNTTRVMQS
jgi:hypothetical protein